MRGGDGRQQYHAGVAQANPTANDFPQQNHMNLYEEIKIFFFPQKPVSGTPGIPNGNSPRVPYKGPITALS